MSKLGIELADGWATDELINLVEILVSNVDKKTIENEPSVRLCNYMDVYSNDYITSDIDFMNATASKSQISKFKIKEGDVMITKDSETPDDIGIAAVSLENFEDVICGYHLALLKPKKDKIVGFFLAKQLGQYQVNRQFANRANGSTRYGLTLNVIETAVIPYPISIDKQSKIAHILTTCDTVIEQTQSAIAKYKAIKQGLLHDLFTQGLDANGKLRPSYHDAPELYKESELGMIPKEWEVKRLEEIAAMKSGDGITSAFISDTGDFPVYGGNGLRGFTTTYTHQGDYVLIGRQGALCGNITRVSSKFFASEHAVVVTVNKDIDVDWLSQKLNYMNLNQYSEASAQPGLAVAKILRLCITKPQHNEQIEMGKRLLALDNKMIAEETLLQKYQSIKRGLMGDLLGGRKTLGNDA